MSSPLLMKMEAVQVVVEATTLALNLAQVVLIHQEAVLDPILQVPLNRKILVRIEGILEEMIKLVKIILLLKKLIIILLTQAI